MRGAFTLVELVVVILILGILSGIAAPRFLETSALATENSHRQTLSAVRNAIELYGAVNGELPGQTKSSDDLKAELAPFLRGDFPENPFGADEDKASEIKISAKGNPLSAGGNDGWLYDNVSGEFISNSAELSSDGVTTYAEF